MLLIVLHSWERWRKKKFYNFYNSETFTLSWGRSRPESEAGWNLQPPPTSRRRKETKSFDRKLKLFGKFSGWAERCPTRAEFLHCDSFIPARKWERTHRASKPGRPFIPLTNSWNFFLRARRCLSTVAASVRRATTKCQCYKSFFVSNLRIFVIS